jgi:hypothetical protein
MRTGGLYFCSYLLYLHSSPNGCTFVLLSQSRHQMVLPSFRYCSGPLSIIDLPLGCSRLANAIPLPSQHYRSYQLRILELINAHPSASSSNSANGLAVKVSEGQLYLVDHKIVFVTLGTDCHCQRGWPSAAPRWDTETLRLQSPPLGLCLKM